MTRVFHPFWKWEDLAMWRNVSSSERKRFLKQAIEFTANDALYGSWMLKVLDAYPVACEHNLTDLGMNRCAWIGHAACLLAFDAPEDIVREAWGYLSDYQRDLANRRARFAIREWERRHSQEGTSVHRQVEIVWVS